MTEQEKYGNGPTVATNLISLLRNVLFSRCHNYDQPKDHGLLQRFVAALFGCLVLHFSLFVINDGQISIPESELSGVGFQFAVAVVFVYSSFFALIVALGSPKGTVIRHFVYGVLLPTTSYLTAGSILFVVTRG